MRADLETPTDNVACELASIATILWKPSECRLELNHLRPEYFTDPIARMAWEAIDQLHIEGEPIDACTVSAQLAAKDLTAADKVMAIYAAYISIPSAGRGRLCELDRCYRLRLWQQIARAKQADPTADISELLAIVTAPTPTFSEDDQDRISTGMADEVIADYAQAEELRRSGRLYAGIDCGFEALNDKLNGLMPGELTILGARPSIGKSTLAMQIALNAIQRDKAKVGYITLEMTRKQILGRLAAITAGISSADSSRGRLGAMDRQRYFDAARQIATLPIWIFDKVTTAEGMCGLAAVYPQIDLWIVDHLHRVRGVETEERHRLGNAAERLANLSIDANKHVLLLAQLNRDCEDRPGKRPSLSDLKASGTIEEVACNVCLIHRPGFYEDMRDAAERAGRLDEVLSEVTILTEKCRFGVPGPVRLAWVSDKGIFANAAPAQQAEVAPAARWNPLYEKEEATAWNN